MPWSSVDVEDLLGREGDSDAGLREVEAVDRASEAGHFRSDNRRSMEGVESDCNAFAHAAGPSADENVEGGFDWAGQSGRRVLDPVADGASFPLFGPVPLVGKPLIDEQSHHASRHRRVSAAGGVAEIDDDLAGSPHLEDGLVELLDKAVVAEAVFGPEVEHVAGSMLDGEEVLFLWLERGGQADVAHPAVLFEGQVSRSVPSPREGGIETPFPGPRIWLPDAEPRLGGDLDWLTVQF